MPAILLARLKTLTVQLADAFYQPGLFRRRLFDILEFYADRTYRPGQSGRHVSLLPQFRVPQPVMRQIEIELGLLAAAHPEEAFQLMAAIWADGYLETRLLAIFLLSQVPPDPPEPLIERIRAWAKPGEDSTVLAALLSAGSSRLQRERPDLWQAIIEEWMRSPDPAIVGIGLRALHYLARDSDFENLPVIFGLLIPAMQVVPSNLQADYLDLIETLARRSMPETAYFLRQSINASSDPSIARLVRKTLPFFNQQQQNGLKAALANQAKTR
ncbi:MAG TPA: DNA alkylation repair protein [Anaerolineaceae bacterium]|nr:DNA alkylation repair protein [Anaerolineaceae bacterium]